MGVIQFIIFGLTLTTWLSKISCEKVSYYLINDFVEDFFFAYDVYDFYDRFLDQEETNTLTWLFVTVIFAFLAMFKFLPRRPNDLSDQRSISQLQICLLFTIFCNDLPFIIIRSASWGLYGLEVTGIIQPLKNITFIIFAVIQLILLHRHVINAENREEYICPI